MRLGAWNLLLMRGVEKIRSRLKTAVVRVAGFP